MTTAAELCPYCRRPFADGGGPTDDHVIGDAFGTKAKIPACKHCNNTFGDTIEGELHREESIFRLALAFASMKPLAGTSEGRGVVTDFAEGEVSPRAPDVSVTRDGAKLELHVSGSEPQVRRVLEQFETSQGVTLNIDELIAKGQVVSTPHPTIDVELNWDDKVARRFVGKAGLAAGVYIFGPEFADSDLAAKLRALRNDESVPYEVANPDRLIEAVSGIATNFGVAPLREVPGQRLKSPSPRSRATSPRLRSASMCSGSQFTQLSSWREHCRCHRARRWTRSSLLPSSKMAGRLSCATSIRSWLTSRLRSSSHRTAEWSGRSVRFFGGDP